MNQNQVWTRAARRYAAACHVVVCPEMAPLDDWQGVTKRTGVAFRRGYGNRTRSVSRGGRRADGFATRTGRAGDRVSPPDMMSPPDRPSHAFLPHSPAGPPAGVAEHAHHSAPVPGSADAATAGRRDRRPARCHLRQAPGAGRAPPPGARRGEARPPPEAAARRRGVGAARGVADAPRVAALSDNHFEVSWPDERRTYSHRRVGSK